MPSIWAEPTHPKCHTWPSWMTTTVDLAAIQTTRGTDGDRGESTHHPRGEPPLHVADAKSMTILTTKNEGKHDIRWGQAANQCNPQVNVDLYIVRICCMHITMDKLISSRSGALVISWFINPWTNWYVYHKPYILY
jgi:hypothetical protein